MTSRILRTVDRCIYCGSTQSLSDEHIIPYGLGGPCVLGKASCKSCAAITSRFEMNVLRNLWGPARAALGMPTRRRYRNRQFPIILERDGKQETVEIDPAKFGVPLNFIHFEAPAYLSGRTYRPGIACNGETTHILPSVDHFMNSIHAEFRPKTVTWNISYKPTDFAKFLAKVAFGFAVAQCGLEGIKAPYIVDAILGRTDDIGMWVGCNADAKSRSKVENDFDIRLNVINTAKMEIVAEIKLFGKLETPTYLVVVGEPAPGLLANFTKPSGRHEPGMESLLS